MSAVDVWLAIAAVTVSAIVTRAGLLCVGAGFEPGPRLTAALRYAPACALAGVIAPDLLVAHGAFIHDPANPRLIAALVAAGVFALTRGTVRTIVAGMLAFWALRALH